jgi:hypothetical protein
MKAMNRRWMVWSAAMVMCLGIMAGAWAAYATPVLVDDFEGEEVRNSLGGKANVYVKAPSRIMVSYLPQTRAGVRTMSLMLRYDKQPNVESATSGGWCGYYTLLKTTSAEGNDVYLDGSQLQAISFWVKGETGEETFSVGLADRHWDKIGDSLKSEEIGKYLPSGKITREWQQARIPLESYFLDYAQLAAVTVNFESDLFPSGQGQGVIYLDDVTIE